MRRSARLRRSATICATNKECPPRSRKKSCSTPTVATPKIAARDRRVDRLQAMLEGGPLRLKPVPPNWGNRRLDRRYCLTAALQRARIATRLAQIAYQAQQGSEPNEPSPLLRAYKPLAAAIEAIPNLKSLWRAKSTEDLEIALDKAQSTILEALQSNVPQTRLNAARLMFRSRQARNAAGAKRLNLTLETHCMRPEAHAAGGITGRQLMSCFAVSPSDPTIP